MSSTSTTERPTEMGRGQTVQDALAEGKLYSDNIVYRFIQMPLSQVGTAISLISKVTPFGGNRETPRPFAGLLIDKDEVTLMIPSATYEGAVSKKRNHDEDQVISPFLGKDNHELGSFTYRLITFDVVLQPTLIGFMAYITKALASADISVLPFGAYSRDHLFVQEGDYEKAMQVLQDLMKEKRQE